jgi:hypothetical protein
MVVDVRCGSGSDGDPGDGDGGLGGGLDGGLECELMEVALRRKAQTDHQTARWAAEFETSGAWQASGAVSAQAWMMFHHHLSKAEAGRFLRWGRALGDLPLVDAAFSEGRITGDHVEVLVGLDHGATKDPLHHQEQLLVDLALTLTFREFTEHVAYWRQHNDPDGTTEEAEKRRNRRDVQLSESLGGLWFGRMVLDPVSGTVIANELERLTELLFQADWSEATERLKRTPLVSELRRTLQQRRADALLMMARRSASRIKGSQKPSPLFFVHMDWDTVYGALSELEDGTPLPPNELLSWLEGADIVAFRQPPEGPATVSHATKVREITLPCVEKILNDTPDRQECSPFDRVFTGATRLAIEIRDRRCAHPYCDRPARWCEIDHIRPWSQGGLTTQENGRLLCGFHNRWYYQREQRPGAPGRTGPETRPPPRRE